MAIGTIEVKTVGRVIFDLVRGDETTTRTIEIPYPLLNEEQAQAALDAANPIFDGTGQDSGQMNLFVQPANWRDTNNTEDSWTTTGLRYEIVETSITPFTPTGADTLSAAHSATHHIEEQPQEQEQQG